MRILGIDLGLRKSVACSYDTATAEERIITIATNPVELDRLVDRERPDQVVVEAGTPAGWVHDRCVSRGVRCRVASPTTDAWKWKAVKRKTDRDDARKLVELAEREQLPEAHVPQPAVRQKRALLRTRHKLLAHRVAWQNHIRGTLLGQGLPVPLGHRAWSDIGLKGLAAQSKPLSRCEVQELWRGELFEALVTYRRLLRQQRRLEKRLDALNADDAAVRRLQTVPGVGPRTAEVVAAYLDEPRRFRRGDEVSAYAGLVPRQWQSGQTDRRGRISKRGPGLLRKVLVECGWGLLRYNRWGATVVKRISRGQKTRRKQAVVAVARKLLVRCWALLRDGTEWREPSAAT